MPKITQQDIFTSFGRNIIERGTRYFKESRVLSCEFDEEKQKLTGSVKGHLDAPYQTSALIKKSNKGGFLIHSTCNCPVGWNCKHAVALFLPIRLILLIIILKIVIKPGLSYYNINSLKRNPKIIAAFIRDIFDYHLIKVFITTRCNICSLNMALCVF